MTKNFVDYFKIIEILGEGTSGKVISAKTKSKYKKFSEGSLVAVKLIKLDPKKKEIIIKDADKEIDILKDVSFMDTGCNPGIVCYYDSFIVNFGIKDITSLDFYAIVMEYIQGYSLEDFISSVNKSFEKIYLSSMGIYIFTYDITSIFEYEQIYKFMLHLSKTLEFLHTRDIVHRDIKTGNIMLSKSDNAIKYVDFGFSCFIETDHTYECEEKAVGTPITVSPELWLMFSHKIKNIPKPKLFEMYKKADVWALGITFYELLFGILPPELEESVTNPDIASAVLDKTLTFPQKFNGNPKLVGIVRNMLIKDYKTRSSMNEVINELNKI